MLVGNHRDGECCHVHSAFVIETGVLAWVMGAADPSSGTVAVNEVIRGLGALLKEEWKPLRTIVIASWDAEEVGPQYYLYNFP